MAKARKKILLVNDFESGGGAEGVFQLTAELLAGNGYDVFTYTAYKGFTDVSSNPFAYIYSRKHFKNIKELIVQKDIDIIHIHNFRWISPSVLQIQRWLKKKGNKKVKFILTAHDYLLACPNVAYGYYAKGNAFVRYDADKKPGSFLFKQMDQHGIKFSILKKMQWYLAFKILHLQNEIDVVISPSFFLQKILHLSYPELPIQVVRNPISDSVTSSSHEIKLAKPTDGMRLRLIYFGRVASEKGTDLLLKMLSELKGVVDFHLDIFGTGPLSEEINPLIESLSLSNQVKYNGFEAYETLQKNFGDYDAFIMSSIWYENAPLSIVEAAINGLWVITPNMGGMKEIAALCGSDFFYELDQVDSLKTALFNTWNFKKSGLASSGILSIKDTFSIENYRQKVKHIYEDSTCR